MLVYMLTQRGYIDGIHVTIYSIHGSVDLLVKVDSLPTKPGNDFFGINMCEIVLNFIPTVTVYCQATVSQDVIVN